MKVLNLFAGIGGNRKLWTDCEVTAVELDPTLAAVYKQHFPQDEVVVTDAHQFLVANFHKYDFIWSSPPCQTHSSMRQNLAVRFRGTPPVYPDMRLYQEIIFLQANAKCLWVVENVRPYYQPLIKAQTLERHLFWANFTIEDADVTDSIPKLRSAQIPELSAALGFDLRDTQISNKRQVLRNCVNPNVGQRIFNTAKKIWELNK